MPCPQTRGRSIYRSFLQELRTGFRGRPYNKLMQHHLKRQSDGDGVMGLQGTMETVSPPLRPSPSIYRPMEYSRLRSRLLENLLR
jgi:hypothetical protein